MAAHSVSYSLGSMAFHHRDTKTWCGASAAVLGWRHEAEPRDTNEGVLPCVRLCVAGGPLQAAFVLPPSAQGALWGRRVTFLKQMGHSTDAEMLKVKSLAPVLQSQVRVASWKEGEGGERGRKGGEIKLGGGDISNVMACKGNLPL